MNSMNPILEQARKDVYSLFPKGAKNRSFPLVWDLFYKTRLLKYVHKHQFSKIRVAFNKIIANDKLSYLCDLGYFYNPQKYVYTATDKVLPVLKEAGYIIEILPEECKGIGDINELNNTEVFIQALKLNNFHTLLYPNFKDRFNLIPDALLVLKRDDKYMLTFLEVEAEKPSWNNYIEKKRIKYIDMSKDVLVHNYWKETGSKLNLKIPPLDKFKFSVTFVSSLQRDFGNGFIFKSSLSD